MNQHFRKCALSSPVMLALLLTLALTPAGRCQATSPAGSRPGAASDVSSTPPSGQSAAPTVPVIGVGDLLKVSIFGAPESDQDVRVGANGDVSLNFIGAVHLAGLTPDEAQGMIAKKLAAGNFFTEPQVSVFVKEYTTQGVSVLGEVQKPGIYPLLGARRLFDILSLAGGTTQRAGRAISITHRDHPESPRTVMLSNNATESAETNVDVFPGDTVLVSKAGIVYVVGDVRRPSGVVMENGTQMTVLQAIAMAEGTNPTAALNRAKLIRKSSSGPHEQPLELKKILSAKSPDVYLQAEDIIFVPSSMTRSAGTRSLEAILQVATGLAVYRP